jgi:hypothetical protein
MAEPIGEHLDLHVPGPLDELLDVDRAGAERRQGFRGRAAKRRRQLRRGGHAPHALSTAPRGGLEHDRVPDGSGDLLGHRGVGHGFRRSRYDRHACRFHPAPGFRLLAHRTDRVGRRTDPGEARRDHGFREHRPLGQKAVARVHGIRTRALRGGEHPLDVEIGLARGRGPDGHGQIRRPDMRAQRIGLRVHRDRLEALLVARADDAEGDFAAVGYEHSLQARPQLADWRTGGP